MRILESLSHGKFLLLVSRREFGQTNLFRSIRQNLSFFRDDIHFVSTCLLAYLALWLLSTIYSCIFLNDRKGRTIMQVFCDPCELKHMDRFARKIKNAGS